MSSIIQAAGNFVTEKFENSARTHELVYHDLVHVKNVVEAADEIGEECGIDPDQKEVLLLAAWFHDIGYLEDFEDHESIGCEKAEKFLRQHNYPEAKLKQVKDCIMATEIPQEPETLLEQIICDADLSHLASDAYFERAEALRQELETRHNIEISRSKWLENNIHFLQSHNYFTPYAKRVLAPRKQDNFLKVKRALEKLS